MWLSCGPLNWKVYIVWFWIPILWYHTSKSNRNHTLQLTHNVLQSRIETIHCKVWFRFDFAVWYHKEYFVNSYKPVFCEPKSSKHYEESATGKLKEPTQEENNFFLKANVGNNKLQYIYISLIYMRMAITPPNKKKIKKSQIFFSVIFF